jgi:DNA gyrase/topoisomerase IV subunit A
MEVNIVTKNGVSALSVKTDFNKVLEKNFAAICEAIANKGTALKELANLFEKEDNSLDTIIQIMTNSIGKNAAFHSLSEKLGVSQATARYLLDMSLENLTALNAMKLKRMLDDYHASISRLVV